MSHRLFSFRVHSLREEVLFKEVVFTGQLNNKQEQKYRNLYFIITGVSLHLIKKMLTEEVSLFINLLQKMVLKFISMSVSLKIT